MHKALLVLTIYYFVVGSFGQSCDSKQFAIRNSAGDDYLTINSPTDVKTCGGVNICDEINTAKQDTSSTNEIQSLSLDPSGQLSISSGNSVNLPDNSATNEIQALSINSNTISLSNGGGSVVLPDASATNEIQQLSIDNNQMTISNGNTVQLPSVWSYTKNYAFTEPGVPVTATTWSVVGPYELILSFPSNFSTVQIVFNVPYSGCTVAAKRFRIQLVFDGTSICDTTLMNQAANEWTPVQLFGLVQNVSSGNHVIQIKALVDSGNNCWMPIFGSTLGEGISPSIFGTYNIIGFP